MANAQSSLLGIRPFTQIGERIRINYYQANTGKDIYLFQPVIMNNSGQVQVANIVDASGILGVAIGFLDANEASLPSSVTSLTAAPYLPTSGAVNALVAVADNPNQLFISEEDTGGTIIGSANSSGRTLAFTYLATTGNTTTGIANALLDRSDIAADTGGVFLLVRPYREFVNQDGTYNDVTTNFSKWVVKITSHQMGPMSLANPALLASA